MTTGERIARLAKERGMSLRKLATLAGVSYNTVYSAVRRRSNRIDVNIIEKIASALKIPITDLLGYDFIDLDDGASVAEIDISKISPTSAELLGIERSRRTGFLDIPLNDEENRSALVYLLQNESLDPKLVERLLIAFSKLNFIGQQMLLSNAENMVQYQELSRIQESVTDDQQP